MAKKLIVTADDFGESGEINGAVIKCLKEGIVSDISMLAVGNAFEDAVRLTKENGITKLGAHLALTGPFKSLQGIKFSGNYGKFLAGYFTGAFSKGAIYNEFKAQIARIKRNNLTISHIDSHQHIHMIPGVFKIVTRLMKEESIEYVRFPRESFANFKWFSDIRGLARNLVLRMFCGLSGKILKDSGLKYNDSYIGHAFGLKIKEDNLTYAIHKIKDGLAELGCHPGKSDDETSALCSKEIIDSLKKNRIKSISY